MGGGELSRDVGASSALAQRWANIDPSVPKPRVLYSWIVCSISALAGLAFGWDIGVMASIFSMDEFKKKYAYTAWDKSWIVSFLLLGCTVGSLFQGYLADKLGRKISICVGSFLFTIGGAIQAFADPMWMLFVGRFIAGLAVGMFSWVVPVYMSESIIHTFRGRMVTFMQFMNVLGIASAYWCDYLTYVYVKNEWQWRAPLFVQVCIGAIIFSTIVWLPRSPRWLLSKGREEESLRCIAKLRMLPIDNEYVLTEFQEMKEALEEDKKIGQSTYKELITLPLRKRFLVGSMINIYLNLTGTGGVNYYAPDFYKQLSVGTTDTILLLQGCYGLLKLVMTIPTFFIVDNFGRRPLLMGGSTIQTTSMASLGILFAITTGGDKANISTLASNHSLGIFGVFLIWFFVVGYNASWGPVVWVLSSEIYPLRMRAKAVSVTTSFQWFANFLVGLAIPPALDANTYAIFFAFAAINFSSIFYVYFFVPETKGKTLEEMDALFGSKVISDSVNADIEIGDVVEEKK